jgi:UDPglucose 6-dehydrogenase
MNPERSFLVPVWIRVMQVSIVGSGYVGTSVAACFADLGHEVTNVDIDEDIVAAINAGESPINEPGLDDLVATYGGDRMEATTNYDAALDTDLTFLALLTPSRDDGSIDLSYMEAAAETLGETLAETAGEHTVVVKSTVIPGTTADVITPIIEDASGMTAGEDLHVAMNPEFQREGTAVEDFMHPDKIVLGSTNPAALKRLNELYAPLLERHDAPVVETGTREAEMIKYANNAFLASKVSLINDLGNICKELDVDAYEVANAIGLDDRIGARFLRSGLGFGGSCFPKDVKAITHSAREHDYDPAMLEAAIEVNDRQPDRLLGLMDRHVNVAGERVAVLGLAFKPGTDDIRNARAIPVIEGLRERGAEIAAYDPVASEHMREEFPGVEYATSPEAALEDAVATLIVTEWEEITGLNAEFDRMTTPVVIDGRRAIERRDGIVYEGLTW